MIVRLLRFRTALHWASKRNHVNVVEYLISNGADVETTTNYGQKAADLSTNTKIVDLLGGKFDACHILLLQFIKILKFQLSGDIDDLEKRLTTKKPETFVPNYIANPVFPYTDPGPMSTTQEPDSSSKQPSISTFQQKAYQNNVTLPGE